MPRLTKLYTRKGDDGSTGLGGGQRVQKDSLRVTAYGSVDELNSIIGVAVAQGLSQRLMTQLPLIQNELFHLGSDLCFIEADKKKFQLPEIQEKHVKTLETLTDELSAIVGPLENFILPGGSPGAAQLQVARTVCRRAERDVIALAREETIGSFVLPYLNRLSDALFIMGRYENFEKQVAEPLWDTLA